MDGLEEEEYGNEQEEEAEPLGRSRPCGPTGQKGLPKKSEDQSHSMGTLLPGGTASGDPFLDGRADGLLLIDQVLEVSHRRLPAQEGAGQNEGDPHEFEGTALPVGIQQLPTV